MALPSQSERSTNGNRHVTTRSPAGGMNRPVIGVVIVLVIVVGAYAVYRMVPGPAKDPVQAVQGPSAKPLGAEVNPPSTVTPPLAAKPAPVEPPVTIKQGTGGGVLGAALNDATANQGVRPAPIDVTAADLKPAPKFEPATPIFGANVPAPVTSVTPGVSTPARTWIEAGDRALAAGKPLEARVSLSRALLSPDAGPTEQESLRQKLTRISDDLVFGPKVTPGDGLVETYTVQPGDSLQRIARRRGLATDYRLIQRVNHLANPDSIQVDQKLKLVRGPFHAVVHRADFRLDLFTGSPDEPENWQFVRSFKVGLGEGNSTPPGTFVVKKNSKLVNPRWVNPRTGEQFAADDADNPIGEHWLGIAGTGDAQIYQGLGLHGTIEPASIGQQKSMGCVRMASEDIATVWEMLTEQVSVVRIE